MLKLPKSLQNPDLEHKLQRVLSSQSKPLYEGSELSAPVLGFTEPIVKLLKAARRAGHLVGGFEKILKQLRNESSGILALQSRGKNIEPQSTTRLLLLTNEGSTRFYRNADIAAASFEPWLAILRLDVSPQVCGNSFFGKDAQVKAMLLDQKEWVSQFFQTWLEDSSTNEYREG